MTDPWGLSGGAGGEQWDPGDDFGGGLSVSRGEVDGSAIPCADGHRTLARGHGRGRRDHVLPCDDGTPGRGPRRRLRHHLRLRRQWSCYDTLRPVRFAHLTCCAVPALLPRHCAVSASRCSLARANRWNTIEPAGAGRRLINRFGSQLWAEDVPAGPPSASQAAIRGKEEASGPTASDAPAAPGSRPFAACCCWPSGWYLVRRPASASSTMTTTNTSTTIRWFLAGWASSNFAGHSPKATIPTGIR